jgi:hypothetical protein
LDFFPCKQGSHLHWTWRNAIGTFLKGKRDSMENRVKKCWLTAPGVLQGRHQLVNIGGKRRWNECFMMILFVVRIPYRGTVHYLALHIVIRNQHITLLKKFFLNIIPSPLKLVSKEAIWFSYSDLAMSNYKNHPEF